MITTDLNGRKALRIFESFEIDYSLAKHATKRVAEASLNTGGISNQVWMTSANNGVSNSNLVFGQAMTQADNTHGPSLFRRLCAKFCRWSKEKHVQFKSLPVEQVFEGIMGAGKKLEVLTGRLEAHRDAIKEARAMGQTSLVEELEGRTHMVEMESMLFAAGFKEFVEEATVIDFAEKCERGLRLDWIKNFTRLIPHNVRMRKIKMDALMVFDNYCVLHYDPLNQNTSLTKKEIEKKKDPILFGVIKGSRRLYHIGSWIDEHCNLTFGALIDKYGKETLTLN